MSGFDISSPHVHIIPIPRTYIITNINMVRSVDPAKFQKLVRVVRFAPHLCTRDAMRTAKYSDDEVADLSFRRLLQRRLRGGSLDSFRAIVRAEAAPRPNRDERHKTRHDERTPPSERTPPPIEQPPPPAVDHVARPPERTAVMRRNATQRNATRRTPAKLHDATQRDATDDAATDKRGDAT